MNKKISLGAAIAFMAVVASITFVVTMLFSQGVFNKMISNVSQREDMYKKVQEIDKLVRKHMIKTVFFLCFCFQLKIAVKKPYGTNNNIFPIH